MQKKVILTALILMAVILTAPVLNGQSTCKVLMPRIADSYTGSCKQGLAEGEGEAFGIDQYKGEFRKGMPDGQGTYVWQTGEVYKGGWKKGLRDGNGEYSFKYNGRDSLMAGIWKEDEFVGNKQVPPYVIEYRNSVGRVSFTRVGDRPYVKYKFSRNGSELNNLSNLLLQGSSGSESLSTAFTGYEQVIFPFKGKVVFNAPNSFMTSQLTCELRMTINQPGSWVVTIFY
jgi:hypothetical protein